MTIVAVLVGQGYVDIPYPPARNGRATALLD